MNKPFQSLILLTGAVTLGTALSIASVTMAQDSRSTAGSTIFGTQTIAPTALSTRIPRGPNRDFSGQNLTNLNQESANFVSSNCQNTIFDKAILPQAVFKRSNLSGASFKGAHLVGADFRHAHLINTDFSGANLRNIRYRGTDFTGARYDQKTIFPQGFIPAAYNMVMVN